MYVHKVDAQYYTSLEFHFFSRSFSKRVFSCPWQKFSNYRYAAARASEATGTSLKLTLEMITALRRCFPLCLTFPHADQEMHIKLLDVQSPPILSSSASAWQMLEGHFSTAFHGPSCADACREWHTTLLRKPQFFSLFVNYSLRRVKIISLFLSLLAIDRYPLEILEARHKRAIIAERSISLRAADVLTHVSIAFWAREREHLATFNCQLSSRATRHSLRATEENNSYPPPLFGTYIWLYHTCAQSSLERGFLRVNRTFSKK